MKVLSACAEDEGKRLDVFAAEHAGMSRQQAQRLVECGSALLNGRPAKKNERLSDGDVVSIEELAPAPLDALPEDIPLDVVYEDSSVIVINKPKGMVVHPAPGHSSGTVVNAVLYRCGSSLSGIGGAIRPGIVHRIDKDTSGVIVVAKTDIAHVSLSSQLSSHSMERVYHAIALGVIKEDRLEISKSIGRDPKDRKRMAADTKNGKPAQSCFTVLERFKASTHFEARLHTGRTHQIRVHAASIGHPLLGDEVYGWKKPNLGLGGLNGQMLHAKTLAFIHPETGEMMRFDSELPSEFKLALAKLRAGI
jgi:23S rRNA pseudouridine1911/1915/1917 synthase